MQHAQTILIVSALIGLAAAHAGSVLVKYRAPQWLKGTVTLALSTLDGVLVTVSWAPGSNWKVYIGAVLSAFLLQMASHAAGLTNLTAAKTSGFGLDSSSADPLDVVKMKQRQDGTYVADADGATDLDPVS